jgi:hypothetical protein
MEPLLTDEIRQRLPRLNAPSKDWISISLLQVKFFTPWDSWAWYVEEFDGEDLFYGLVEGLETEWGYFSLKELEAIRGPGGQRIERDLNFEPVPAGERHKLHKAAK